MRKHENDCGDSTITHGYKKKTCLVHFTITRADMKSCDYVRSVFNEIAEIDKEHKHTLIDYLTGLITTAFKGDKNREKLSDAMDERMRSALAELNASFNSSELWAIKNGYDYAFIKYALDKLMVHGCEKLSNLTTPKFINYLSRMGFSNCCGDKTINKYLEHTSGDYPRCKFLRVSYLESRRRNAIINKFVELMSTQ